MKEITIYTDGSVYPNPNGMGGWAYVALGLDGGEDKPFEQKGFQNKTTNNRMELMAAIQAVSNCVYRGQFCTIITDSQYVQRCFARKRWPETKPNYDLGSMLAEAVRGRFVEVKHVAGHSGDKYNERAHELANKARLEGLAWFKEREQEDAAREARRAGTGVTEMVWDLAELASPRTQPTTRSVFHRIIRPRVETRTPQEVGTSLEW